MLQIKCFVKHQVPGCQVFRRRWIRCQERETSKESGPKGPGFGLPPEGASIVFAPCGSLLE